MAARALGCRQEALLRVFLSEGGWRQRGLECSVTRSLAKRGLLERGTKASVWLCADGKHDVVDEPGWKLTEEGERVARVCALKEQLRKS
jgi:hypothetical protein